MRTKLLLLIIFSGNTYASPETFISGGEPVAPGDYRDYHVAIELPQGTTCGGTLINGKWILTAKHCTPLWPDNDLPLDSEIRVHQGIGFYDPDELVFEGIALNYYELGPEDQHELRTNFIKDVSDTITDSLINLDELTFYTESSFVPDGYLEDDLALIELSSTIPQKDIAVLSIAEAFSENFAPNSWSEFEQSLHFELGKVVTFMGWGIDYENNNQKPDQLKKVELKLTRQEFYIECSTTSYNETMERLTLPTCDWTEHENEFTPTSASVRTYGYGAFRTHGLLELTGTAPGDSGSPLTSDKDELYGVVSRGTWQPDGDSYRSSFASIQWYTNWIAEQIESLTAPTALFSIYEKPGFYSASHIVRIQNLSTTDQLVNPILTDDSFFNLVEHNCPNMLEPFEVCAVEILSSERFFDNGDAIKAELILNAHFHIPLKIEVLEEDETPPVDPTPPPSSEDSSGGSVTWFSLMLLGLIGLRRTH